jgi:hypothetical protein
MKNPLYLFVLTLLLTSTALVAEPGDSPDPGYRFNSSASLSFNETSFPERVEKKILLDQAVNVYFSADDNRNSFKSVELDKESFKTQTIFNLIEAYSWTNKGLDQDITEPNTSFGESTSYGYYFSVPKQTGPVDLVFIVTDKDSVSHRITVSLTIVP